MKKDNTHIRFALQGIKTEQFAIIEENYTPNKKTDLGTKLQFKLDQKNHKIGVFLGFEFMQIKKVFLKIQVSCHFQIEENSWATFVQENKLVIPKGFLAHLAVITIGTTRGILFAKTEATPFSIFILPTLNIASIIKEDAIFEIKNM
jgi:hypothetical protein